MNQCENFKTEKVEVRISPTLRMALEQRVRHTETNSLETYIREVLEIHIADLRGAARMAQPDWVYHNREPVEELE